MALPFPFPLLRYQGRGSGSLPDAALDESLLLGGRTVVDRIAPAALEVRRDHLRLERQYARVIAVTGYPRSVGPGWLQPLLHLAEPVEISMHVRPLPSHTMVASLSRKLVGLHSSQLLADRAGKLADPERETAYADAERLRDALQRDEERLHQVGLYVLIRAHSPQKLDDRTGHVERAIAGVLAQSRVALFEQEQGWHACLPQGSDRLGLVHNLDTSSLATTFPFTAGGFASPTGILYGVATDSHTPVLVDPFDQALLDNANLAIFAASGAGKSYFTKLLLLRLLLRGTEAVVIDPEDEYRALCQAVGGQRLRLSGGAGSRLNPFDLPPDDQDAGNALAERVAALVQLIGLLVATWGAPLTPEERGVLDDALFATYAVAGISRDPATHGRTPPLLRDLQAVLAQRTDPLAVSLASRLRPYTLGAMAELFASPTDAQLDRPLVVFSVRDLQPALRPLAIQIIANHVWDQARRRPRERLLIVDEAWSLLQYAEGAAFLDALARRARKHWLGLITITQDVADALGHPAGRAVLTNASCKLLLKQDSATIGPLADALHLSALERRHLLGAERGEGLFCWRDTRLPLRILASPREHALATTAPAEVFVRPPLEKEGDVA